MLENLSLEELWKRFPITFADSNKSFTKQFLTEKENLELLLGNYIKRISHIGSTAIKGIKTKPIVDMLIEIDFNDIDIVKEILLNAEYVLMSESVDKISFNKGYTINGYADNVFHIHIKEYGDCDELYFRDYLNDNYKKAKEYEKLKDELYNKYKPDRDLYTEIVNSAKKKYRGKY